LGYSISLARMFIPAPWGYIGCGSWAIVSSCWCSTPSAIQSSSPFGPASIRLTIVNVAYPFAPVRADSVGGAEQIVHLIDRGLVARGHRSVVVACRGSSVAGEFVETPWPNASLSLTEYLRVADYYRRLLDDLVSRVPIDVVHLHGHDFDAYLPLPGVPVLATLHLPPELGAAQLKELRRPATWVHGVSGAHHARLQSLPCLLPPIENGIALDELLRPMTRRQFALVFGRICPEKGFHLALDAARLAGMPLVLGGMVFAYDVHQRYFEREIVPRLDRQRRFVGPLSLRRRQRLLNSARCVLIPSMAEETSSLVAIEALACGTPVIAFARGALPSIVEHGVTGFIVRSVHEMAAAMHRLSTIDPATCQAHARARFSADRMVERYLERYRWMNDQRRLDQDATRWSLSA
jgi:glycosyltransferase involved in cell wall biosynthesis